MRNSRQLVRVVPAQVEHWVFVDQVGQAVGPLLLVRLQPGLVALVSHKLVEQPRQSGCFPRAQDARQGQVTLLVEHVPLVLRQQRRAHAEGGEGLVKILASRLTSFGSGLLSLERSSAQEVFSL